MNWIDSLKTLAPTVATALGGPLAGAAVAALGNLFGVSEPTQDKIGKLFADGQISPDHLAEIRKLEMEYQDKERELGFKYAEMNYKDTDSARNMQVLTHSNMPPILATIVTTGFFGILGFMITNPEFKPSEPILVTLGSLGTAWTMIIGFYFGSSHGSQNKDALLAASTQAQ